jgi:hypothetical protein
MRKGCRQHIAEDALHEVAAGGELLDTADDVGAVGSTDAGPREELRKPGTGGHVRARRAERAGHDPS